jgi:exosome complex component RRP41
MIDLNYIEESSNAATVTLTLLPRLNKLNMIDTESRISLDQFEQVIELGMQGCQQIHQVMDTFVRKSMTETQNLNRILN